MCTIKLLILSAPRESRWKPLLQAHQTQRFWIWAFFVTPLGPNFDTRCYNPKLSSGKNWPHSGRSSYEEHGVHSFTLRTLKSHRNLVMMFSEQLSCTADAVILCVHSRHCWWQQHLKMKCSLKAMGVSSRVSPETAPGNYLHSTTNQRV